MLNVEKFWTRVAKSDNCWIWLGYKDQDGYGRVTVNYYPRMVHRVAYELLVGPIPSGLYVDHLCRVRDCCNPEHLDLVTTAENNRRGIEARGKAPWQQEHGTRARYQKMGCRCEPCVEARRAYDAGLKARKLATGDFVHGTQGYRVGCKCDICRLANNADCLARYHRRKLQNV